MRDGLVPVVLVEERDSATTEEPAHGCGVFQGIALQWKEKQGEANRQ